jgi:hypothetical protein
MIGVELVSRLTALRGFRRTSLFPVHGSHSVVRARVLTRERGSGFDCVRGGHAFRRLAPITAEPGFSHPAPSGRS